MPSKKEIEAAAEALHYSQSDNGKKWPNDLADYERENLRGCDQTVNCLNRNILTASNKIQAIRVFLMINLGVSLGLLA